MLSTDELGKLSVRDLDEVMDLYVDCFLDDGYYREAFGKKGVQGDVAMELAMRGEFTPQVRHVLDGGLCCGLRRDGVLIGMTLCIDYMRVRREDEILFRQLFYDGDVLPYAGALHGQVRLAATEKPVVYLLAIAVSKDCRRRHLASDMLDQLICDHLDCFIASDVSNGASLPMYSKRGFSIIELEPGYFLVMGPERRV